MSRSSFLTTRDLKALNEACRLVAEGFGATPYLVGSAGERPDYRDVDVRLILPDDQFDALFGTRPHLWSLISFLASDWLGWQTGLPVDFQIQRMTEANEKFHGSRNSVGTSGPALRRGRRRHPVPRGVGPVSEELEAAKSRVLHHIVRAILPWRQGPETTECGRPVTEMAAVWTRDQAIAKFKELGQQRFALMVCMTCADTANSWPTWEQNPVRVMGRFCSRAGWDVGDDRKSAAPSLLERELRALAALAHAHPDEFEAMVDGLSQTEDLSARRQQKRYGRRSR